MNLAENPTPMVSEEKTLEYGTSPAVTTKLHQKRAKLQAELAQVNEAIEVLEAHPEVQKVIDTIARVSRFI